MKEKYQKEIRKLNGLKNSIYRLYFKKEISIETYVDEITKIESNKNSIKNESYFIELF